MPRTFINGVATPVNDADPTTKVYVDRYCPIAGRATTYEGTDGTSGTGTAVTTYARTGRTIHKVIGAASALKLEYQNWYTQPNAPGEVDNPNAVTYRAAVEYPAGKLRQVSGSTAWNSGTAYSALDQVTYLGSSYVALITTTPGTAPTAALGTQWQLVTRYQVNFSSADVNRRVTVAGGGNVVSLPILLSIVEGQYLAVTTTVSTGSASNKFSADIVGTGSMDFAQDYPSGEPTVGSVDLVDIDATTQTNMATATRVPMPSAVLGLGKSGETVRHVGIVGDSLMMGYLDTEVDSHKKGIGVRGAEYEDVRYRRVPQGGDRMMYWTAANAAKRLALVQPATSVFCDLGSNDIANSRTLAQLQADAITTWTELGRQGARVFQMTILPKTTSTDSWATKANQTPVAPAFAAGGVRQTFNAWLRAGASTVINGVTVTLGMAGHPLSGVVDISSAVEDTTDSNYWKSPSWTTDGGHPTATGYDALAQAMRPWMSSMVVGNQLKHAGLHAVGGPDPVTPASIGAADAATLGGYLPTLLPWGGFQDYLVRGDVMSSAPAQSATSTIAMSVTVRTIVVLLDYMTAITVNGLKFALQTAMVGGTASIAAYSGTNIAALARLGAAFAPTMTGTDVRSSALPTPQASAAGYYAIQLTLTGTAPSTYPVLAATPAVPSNCGLLANPPSGAIAAGSSTGTTAPGSTLDLSGTGGWTKLLQKPWFAEY